MIDWYFDNLRTLQAIVIIFMVVASFVWIWIPIYKSIGKSQSDFE